ERDVVDDGLGDSSAEVADDRGVAELQAEEVRGIDSVVEAGEDEHLCGWRAERHGGECTGEALGALQQRGDLAHGCSFIDGRRDRSGRQRVAVGRPTPWRAAISRIAVAKRSGCSLVIRWPPGNRRISASGTRSRAARTWRCSYGSSSLPPT